MANENPGPPNRPSAQERTSASEGLQELARLVLNEGPDYVVFSDSHVGPDAQHVSAAFLQTTFADPDYASGGVGFYVEALYDTARPEEGDFSGGVIGWDVNGKTRYRETVQKVVDLGVPVHGIDIDDPEIGPEDDKRMRHWQRVIEAGPEDVKVLLVGGGHLFNNPQKTADLMYRLDGEQWVADTDRAYKPPGASETTSFEPGLPDLSRSTYILSKYTHD